MLEVTKVAKTFKIYIFFNEVCYAIEGFSATGSIFKKLKHHSVSVLVSPGQKFTHCICSLWVMPWLSHFGMSYE